MGQNKIKNKYRLGIVAFFSIVHVHLSMFTGGNPFNPLTFFMIVNSTFSWLNEINAFMFGGMIIQSCITIFIARKILGWNEHKIWMICICFCFPLVFLGNIFAVIFGFVTLLDNFYINLYRIQGGRAILLIFIQMFLLCLYIVILHKTKSKFK